MELVLVFVIAAVILIALGVSLRFLRSENSGVHTQSTEPSQTSLTGGPPAVPNTGQASRFDPTSSKHLYESRTLSGPAYVVDGDTIKIKNTQIRLFGVDAPELNHPYGIRAKRALRSLCKDQVIRAEVSDVDSYGRTVAHCYLPDGRDLSAEMVRRGLAIDWPKFSGGKYKNLETIDARRKLFLADARQKGRMHVWEKFEATRGRQ